MEAYSISYGTSNSFQNPDEAKGLKNAYSFQSHSLLHSVRKSQTKPWKKAPVAPPPPTPIRVYKVDPINFRDLVQQLTGAPEFKPQVTQSFAAGATSLLDTPSKQILSDRNIAAASSTVSTNWYQRTPSEELGMESHESIGGTKGLLELNLSSPSSSYNSCSVPRMSQGTKSLDLLPSQVYFP